MAVLSGPTTWFNHGVGEPGPGPADPGNKSQASGISFDEPGIAVANSSTLRGFWMVKTPQGKNIIVQQTDYGPAPSTGHVFDQTWSLQKLLGGDPSLGTSSGVYLGKSFDEVIKYAPQAMHELGIKDSKSIQVLSRPLLLEQAKRDAASNTPTGLKLFGFQIGPATGSGVPQLPNASATGPGDTATPDIAGVLKAFFTFVTDTAVWMRFAEGLAGLILLYIGFRTLTGNSASVPTPVGKVRIA